MLKERMHFSILVMCVTLWSFAPTVSFLFQMNISNGSLIEICTPSGLTTIALDETGNIPSENNKEHPSCSFCAIASTTSGATLPLHIVAQHHSLETEAHNYKQNKEFIISSSFKRGLNIPHRAPPVLS